MEHRVVLWDKPGDPAGTVEAVSQIECRSSNYEKADEGKRG